MISNLGIFTNVSLLAGISVNNLLSNLKNGGQTTGVLFLALVGFGLFVWSIYGIAVNLFASNSQRQPKWGIKVAGLIVGGSLMGLTGQSFGIWQELANGGEQTLTDAARGGSAVPELVLIDESSESIK